MPAEPEQAHEDGEGIDEAQVGEHGDKVNIQLLVGIQIFDVDTNHSLVSFYGMPGAVTMQFSTHVFRPDSVEPLAPKNKASIALRFPAG